MLNDKIYVVNPDYNIKTDKNRVVIYNRKSDPREENFTGFVHPIYAILLTLFDGKNTLPEIEEKMMGLLNMDRQIIAKIIEPLLENKEKLFFEYDGTSFSFPTNLLVRKSEDMVPYVYSPESFRIPKKDLDLKSWRLNTPLDFLQMINTLCFTDCLYCYADRRVSMDCEIPFERFKELIAEARKLEMRTFDISGGEFLLYKHWDKLIKELLDNGFNPYISTKIPINLETIKKMQDIGMNRIQISIDSIIKEELMSILKVGDDYLGRLMETFKNLDENRFTIFTNSQINSINQDNMHQLFDYLLTLENIKRISVGAAGYSIYKGEEKYNAYKPDLEKVKAIEASINELKEKHKDRVNINFSGYNEKSNFFDVSADERKKKFYNRSRCSANFTGFIVLPDGKVTICEELYWHPNFIIGDLKTQSIEEVWNSKRALELYQISQDMIRDESECKTCDEFEPCHRYKGVCWKEILYAYGYENWDYPDPKCHKARKPIIEYYL